MRVISLQSGSNGNCIYPEFLKERIAGPAGHISNLEAADYYWQLHRNE